MLYLLWGLLNIAVFVFFIITCFRATRLLREKFGFYIAFLFVVGLLSFLGISRDDNGPNEPGSSQLWTWTFVSEDSVDKSTASHIYVDLDKTLTSACQLGIQYCKDKQGWRNMPVSAHAWRTGFVSGTNWKPTAIRVNQAGNKSRFDYAVEGMLEWKFLGATIYTELKEYKGTVLVK